MKGVHEVYDQMVLLLIDDTRIRHLEEHAMYIDIMDDEDSVLQRLDEILREEFPGLTFQNGELTCDATGYRMRLTNKRGEVIREAGFRSDDRPAAGSTTET